MERFKRAKDTNWFKLKFEEKSLTQREVAKVLGLKYPSLSHIISGKTRMSLRVATDLADLLGVDISVIATEAEHNEEKGDAKHVEDRAALLKEVYERAMQRNREKARLTVSRSLNEIRKISEALKKTDKWISELKEQLDILAKDYE